MPRPTPLNPHPARAAAPAKSVLAAITNSSALAMPATSRSASQAPSDALAGISASVAISVSRDSRAVSRDRARAGTKVGASAPMR